MSAIRTLLQESIDYAGLFPPAELDMGTAVANHARYAAGPASWALGRFIVPVSRLEELEHALTKLGWIPSGAPWRIAALLGQELEADLKDIEAFNHRHRKAGTTIDSVEVKATSEGYIGEIIQIVPSTLQTYIEVPIESDPSNLIRRISRGGRRGKVRTGGVTQEAFPRAPDLLRFLRAAVDNGVPFKATAGLHHPFRAMYRLTYAENSPMGRMFGFLNLMLAVAFLRSGMNEPHVMEVLEEEDPRAFQADDSGISWQGHRVGLDALSDSRRLGMVSFGSCSFTEPIADLQSLHLLAAAVPQR
jgi:hypothetical protein